MKKVLFIDRDGTLILEPPVDYQVDSFEKLEYYPGVFTWLGKIARELEYDLVMVSNQDGLGTASFPEDTFWPVQNRMVETLKSEGIEFQDIYIDPSFPEDNSPNRKPGTGMLSKYIFGNYDLQKSFVIGDRESDIELAKNLGAKGIFIGEKSENADLSTSSWKDIYLCLKNMERKIEVTRNTNETKISLELNLDGSGQSKISTGIGFFDHMLEQICKHGQVDINLQVDGDLEVDEHHTIEDVALTLGDAFNQALGQKKGIERYGFLLPMDESLAQVAIDFGGRPDFVWRVEFKREYIGEMPTEMFAHFFKSFSDTAKCNLNIQADGVNEHHKIEGIFKAFAKSILMAKRRLFNEQIPSSKGVL